MTWWNPLSWLTPAPSPVPPTPPPAPADVAAELLELVNSARAERALAPLTADGRLTAAAARHAGTMAAVGILAHQGLGDGYPWSRASAAGYQWSEVAENIAEGYPTAAAAMAGWLVSPGHLANILGPSVDFGAAVAADGKGRLWWSATFAEPRA
jgi:uncharacterized protein YkwD